MLIEPELEQSARAFLDHAMVGAMISGATLLKGGKVKFLSAENGTFSFSVADGKMKSVLLVHKESTWLAACTCPKPAPCKHACAAMLMMLDKKSKQASVEAPAATQKPATPAVEKKKSGPETFADLVEARLGRALSKPEKKTADEVEDLYQKYGGSKRIAEYVLGPFLGGKVSSWNYQMHELWPSKPKDAWEAWVYLAAFLQSKKVPLPAFLRQITEQGEIDALTAEREHRLAVAFWRDRLARTAYGADHTASPLVKLRVVLHQDGIQLEWQPTPEAPFEPVKKRRFDQMYNDWNQGFLNLLDESVALWTAFRTGAVMDGTVSYSNASIRGILNALFRNPQMAGSVVSEQGEPFVRESAVLRWTIQRVGADQRDYEFHLTLPDGTPAPRALAVLSGNPPLYITATSVFQSPPIEGLSTDPGKPTRIPAAALESSEGVALLDWIGAPLPPELEEKTETIKVRVVFKCKLTPFSAGEILEVAVEAIFGDADRAQIYLNGGWYTKGALKNSGPSIERLDRSAMRLVPGALDSLNAAWSDLHSRWQRKVTSKFPAQFVEWLTHLSSQIEVELDPVLSSLAQAPLSASVQLDVAPAGIDWFDLKVALKISDTELTEEELALLIDANGQYVRLGAKGWRRLAFNISPEDEAQMADIGINSRDFSSKPQRFHALQLANKATARLLSDEQAAAIERRAEEIQTRVSPEVPKAIQADLRPYQIAGFHFLAYLSTNRFGGILADDMGLGKTVQTLAWLAWLRGDSAPGPSLVVCPKSVIDNWQNEAKRFFPELRVKQWRGGTPDEFQKTLKQCDLMVVNYAQLRIFEESLSSVEWHAAILDEAQFIKNPSSQTTRVACALRASHRLALSGTPIENRLLDLWSIMMFSMPGVLGARADFAKRFDQRADPLARRRLSARVRPFVLRRTKGEVASDLPDRIEEDILCELEGVQATLYQAELKSARQQLLNLKTARDLDKARFNVLTSLLRLRQICCHPALVGGKTAESAKVNALLDLLEPIMEQGSKVLVFSQFVEMLAILEVEIKARNWPSFKLTGQTENRGALVDEFQASEGPAVFLISLRAGGFGLNLTAASYVVLFDPWWNPAAESQAIDRTHRIGQTSKVIAYRLLVKGTIEEKIRALQRQKSALASDVLGEETFAKALTMEDFQFLLT